MGIVNDLKTILNRIMPSDRGYTNRGTQMYPSGAVPLLNVTTGAAAIGTWDVVVAAASMSADFWLESIFAETDEAEVGTLQIGTGASGSESAIATIVVSPAAAASLKGTSIPLLHPIFIPSGTRITARFWTTTDGGTAQVKIIGSTGL